MNLTQTMLYTTGEIERKGILYVKARNNETLEYLTEVFYASEGDSQVTKDTVKMMRQAGHDEVNRKTMLKEGTMVRIPAPPPQNNQHLWCNGRSYIFF